MLFRHALRSLVKQPSFTWITIATLALGIGAATSIFSVVESVLLRPLPYRDAERLVVVWETSDGSLESNVSGANLIDWQDQNESFDGLAALTPRILTRTGGVAPERLAAVEVTPNFFDVMGVRPQRGRTFTHDDADADAVVLAHEYWMRAYGSDADAVGTRVTLDGRTLEVIGIAPAGFKIPFENADVWTRSPKRAPTPPLDVGVPPDELRGLHWLRVLGRLEASTTLDEAQADMDLIAARLREAHPDDNSGRGVHLVPLHEQITGDVKPALAILLGAVLVLLAIGCANVASLLLARASGREKELAVRSALGASRTRIALECLVESLVLALAGGAAGVLLSTMLTRAFLWWGPQQVFRLGDVALNSTVLGFAVLASALTGLGFGILPALQMSKPDVERALREQGRGSSGVRNKTTRSALVVAELSMAVVLLVLSGLLIKSFVQLRSVEPGFRSERVMTLRVWLPDSRYPDSDAVSAAYREMLERIRALLVVDSVSGVLGVPLSGTSASFGMQIEGLEPPAPGEDWPVGLQSVAPGYFETMGIPMLRGRDVSLDDTSDAVAVVVVNRTAAERFWPGEDAIGKRITEDGDNWMEVVGIVGDVLHDGLDQEPRAEVYAPFAQATFPFMTLVLKGRGEPEALLRSATAEIGAVDPELPVYKPMALDEIVASSMAEPRFNTFILTLFAGVALILAAVGIYGLIAMNVGQRQRELGIRLALGAPAAAVFRLVMKDGIVLAVVGIGVGLVGALGASRLLSSILFEVSTTDALTFAWVASILLGITLLATGVPARRASRVDPLSALKP